MAGADPFVRRHGPYDLVFANILARPLCLMARDLALNLAPGGAAILAGLLDDAGTLGAGGASCAGIAAGTHGAAGAVDDDRGAEGLVTAGSGLNRSNGGVRNRAHRTCRRPEDIEMPSPRTPRPRR